jgi:hypothetical protein
MNTTKEPLLVIDGNLILQNKIIDYNFLTIDYVLLLYLPYLLDQTIYDTTLILANVYYEHCPYHGRSGKDVIHGDYLSVSHGYSSHGGPGICGNVGLYHLNSESEAKEHAWRNIGDLIVTNIWKYTDQFGSSIEKFFSDQFSEMSCIAIGLPGNETNVHSLHISKNSKIKPHVNVGDCGASIIIWFNSGSIKGGDFVAHGLWYKFCTSNGEGVFFKSKTVVHGTLQFQSKGATAKDFKLGLALVNKKSVATQDRVFPHYVPNSSIKHSKSDSKDRSQEIP